MNSHTLGRGIRIILLASIGLALCATAAVAGTYGVSQVGDPGYGDGTDPDRVVEADVDANVDLSLLGGRDRG